MGRRAEHSREEQVAMALAAAREILVSEGSGALTARAVAGRMGYSVGSIYNLFDNMSALLLQLNLATLDDLADEVAGVLQGIEAPPDRLRAMARAYVAYARANPDLWRLLFDPALELKDGLPSWYGQQVTALFGIIEAELTPFFGDDDDAGKQSAARALWAGVHGVSTIQLSARTIGAVGMAPDTLVEVLVDTFVAGLETRDR